MDAHILMIKSQGELVLSGNRFTDQPPCWQNFVRHVLTKHKLPSTPTPPALEAIAQELLAYGLHTDYQDGNKVVMGSTDDLISWMLTYA